MKMVREKRTSLALAAIMAARFRNNRARLAY
jgi:hypothetical protein